MGHRLRVHLRDMVPRDLQYVLPIEQASFDEPWRYQDFKAFLQNSANRAVVAEYGSRICGYAAFELRPCAVELVNIAVWPDCRRMGVGSQILTHLYRKATYHNRRRIVLQVRETNLDAQLFFRAAGLRCTRTLRNEYADIGEDAYFFERRCSAFATMEAAT